MLSGTAGSLLINNLLPEDLRDTNRVYTKKNTEELLMRVATEHPEKYKQILKKLSDFGLYNAIASGTSFGLSDLVGDPDIEARIGGLRAKVEAIRQSDLKSKDKSKLIQELVTKEAPEISKDLFSREVEKDNPVASQAMSGSRGSPANFSQLVLGDMLVTDHRGRIIPVPIMHGYGHGVTPAEYWAGSYGARLGSLATKLGTRDAGFLGKQLAMAAHRMVITSDDEGDDPAGLLVKANDPDNVGAVLAQRTGNLEPGHILTRGDIQSFGDSDLEIAVHSPLTNHSSHGLSKRSVGVRERGTLPSIGDNVGLASAQAISEKVSQGSLSTKHSGGIAGGSKTYSGFKSIDQMVQAPKTFKDAATVSSKDGTITGVEDAPQGGKYILVGTEKHYVSPDHDPIVKPGDIVEAGDALSSGIVNPGEVVAHKGIGEGRRLFVGSFMKTLQNAGVSANRRNVEILARALINHVKIDDVDNNTGAIPGDVVSYGSLVSSYEPREGSEELEPRKAMGKYLERPSMHYTIGTRVTPRTAEYMQKMGVDKVVVHRDPPPFSPVMVRAMEVGSKDENPLTRLNSSYMTRSMLHAVHRAESAPTHDGSFVPALADAVNFGDNLSTTGKY